MHIPGYDIEHLIAKGGMSSVYLAVQESLDRRVALKLLEKFDNQTLAARFLREARTIAQLEHRNIITIHDIGTIGERHFIAMEYLQGGSLSDKIAAGMPLGKVLALLEKIAVCLNFVHRRGIIHRDIKPSNILFHADGTPKLTDFGIAKMLDVNQELTMEGSALGSPYYLSPEQAEGRDLDGRSDIYSLGIIFYEMLTGEKPFAKATPIETVVAHLTDPIPQLPGPFAAYQRLLETMIAKDPADRVANAKQLALIIRESREADERSRAMTATPVPVAPGARHPVTITPVDASYREIPSRPTRWPLLIGLALVGLAAGIVQLGSDPPAVHTADIGAGGPLRHAAMQPPAPQAGLTARITFAEPAPTRSAPAADAAVQASPLRAEDAAVAPGADPIVADTAITGPADDTPVVALVGGSATAADKDSSAGGAPQIPAEAPAVEDSVTPVLQAAERAMQAYRLTTPADDNAFDHYRAALAINPGNRAARKGIKRIADRYALLAAGAMRKNDLRRARVYRARGLKVLPQHQELIALGAAIARRANIAQAAQQAASAPQTDTPADRHDHEPDPNSLEALRGREGTGNIIRDVGTVLRAIFN